MAVAMAVVVNRCFTFSSPCAAAAVTEAAVSSAAVRSSFFIFGFKRQRGLPSLVAPDPCRDLLFLANNLLLAARDTNTSAHEATPRNAPHHAPNRPRCRDRQGPTGLHRLLRRLGDRPH